MKVTIEDTQYTIEFKYTNDYSGILWRAEAEQEPVCDIQVERRCMSLGYGGTLEIALHDLIGELENK